MKINLRELRKQNNLSIYELERLSGVDKSTISRIENNEMIPTVLIMCRLCNALHVTLDEMVDYKKWGGFMQKYYNVICEEICVTGGKIIHIDENLGNIEEVHKLVIDNNDKYPNAKWELYTMFIN